MKRWATTVSATVTGAATGTPGRCILLAGLLACSLGLAGCKDDTDKKQEPPPPPDEVSGLAAVPASVRVVVGANVPAIADSWLVERAIGQMFARDPGLETRVRALIDECRVDPARDLQSLVIALGQAPDEDQAVMVATGRFVETEVAKCVSKSLSADGGTLSASTVDRRTFYHAKGPAGDTPARDRSVWFTFGDERTLIVATSSAWLSKAVAPDDKVLSAQPMAGWIEQANTKAGLWGAGMLDDAVGADLVTLAGGRISAAPRAMFGHVALERGLGLELAALMVSPDDAKSLVSLAKSQISLGVLALQRYGIGPLLTKLTVDADDDTVYVRFSLSEDELKQALARIDTTTERAQDTASDEGAPDDSKRLED